MPFPLMRADLHARSSNCNAMHTSCSISSFYFLAIGVQVTGILVCGFRSVVAFFFTIWEAVVLSVCGCEVTRLLRNGRIVMRNCGGRDRLAAVCHRSSLSLARGSQMWARLGTFNKFICFLCILYTLVYLVWPPVCTMTRVQVRTSCYGPTVRIFGDVFYLQPFWNYELI